MNNPAPRVEQPEHGRDCGCRDCVLWQVRIITAKMLLGIPADADLSKPFEWKVSFDNGGFVSIRIEKNSESTAGSGAGRKEEETFTNGECNHDELEKTACPCARGENDLASDRHGERR
jgi:hypothetical protein